MEEKTPLVSVIVPFYNGEKYADALIKSFSAQTFRDFELIAVNDGSTDGTSRLLHSYSAEDIGFPMTVIDKENNGVAAARNCGIASARGKYVCFCDCDDTVSEVFLENMSSALTETGCAVALCLFSNKENDLFRQVSASTVTFSRDSFLKEFLYNGIKYHHCAGMYLRSLLSGEYLYPEGYRYSEDVYLLWKLIASNERIAVVPQKLYCYFTNCGSAMSRMDEGRLDAVELMEKLEDFIAGHAPDFAPEFKKYAVARHYWSIFWQAAACFDTYEKFSEYISIFPDAAARLQMLSDYPDKKVRLTAGLFTKSRKLYYRLMRFYVRHIK